MTTRSARFGFAWAGVAALAGCQAAPQPQPPRAEPAGLPQPAAPPGRLPPRPVSASRLPAAQYSNNAYLAVAVDPETVQGLKGVELWVTDDDAETWSNHGYYEGRPRELKYLASRDGRYGFKLVLVDRDNNRSERPRRGTPPDYVVVVDTQPPLITVEAPNGGDLFRAGAQTLVTWSAVDPNLDDNSILVDYTNDDGRNWFPIAQNENNDGKYFWSLPLVTSGECRIRIHAKDRAGNVGSARSERAFTIDGLPPTLQITGPLRADAAKVDLAYTAADLGGAGLQRVDLWMTKDGGLSWSRLGTDEDAASPIEATLLDGEYGLKLVGVDRVGNASEAPVPGAPPPSRIVVDTLNPEVRLLNFMGGEVVAGGAPVEIRYAVGDAHLGSEPVIVEFSPDDGKTWNAVARDAKPDGPVAWTPPAVSGKAYRLRVRAQDLFNHETIAVSPAFSVDASVPKAVATGPFKSRRHRFDLAYEVRNRGYAPLKRVDVWRTSDGGNTWEKAGSDLDLQSPFPIVLGDGDHGLSVVAVTELGETSGRRQPDPTRAEIPQMTVSVDTIPPDLRLTTFDKRRYLQGGSEARIEWTAGDPHMDPRGLSLWYTVDGGQTWLPIGENLDASAGSVPWRVPGLNATGVRIKAAARDLFDNVAEVVSAEDSLIDSYPPKGRLGGPGAVRSQDFRLPIVDAEDVGEAGIQKVEIWWKDLETPKSWEPAFAQTGPARNEIGGLFAPIKTGRDGRYGFFLVLTDNAGNATPSPQPDTPPQIEVLVDTEMPKLHLVFPVGGVEARHYAGTELPIRWEAGDANFDDRPISLYYSLDGGATWKVITQDAPNTGEFLWAIPGKASDRCRVKVVATDRAGNAAEAASPQFFRIEFPEPTITIERAPDQPVFGGGRVALAWRLSLGELQPDTLRLEISRDGLTWKTYQPLLGRGPAGAVTMHAPREAGVYWLRIAGLDLLRVPIRSRETLLTVQDNLKRPPQVKLHRPAAGEILRGGQDHLIMVDLTDADDDLDESTLSVEFSEDGGRDFKKLEGLQRVTGGLAWRVPSTTSMHCRLRISIQDSEGMRGEDSSAQDFRVDSAMPEAVAVGPAEAAPGPIEIHYRGTTTLSRIQIYWSDETGSRWQEGPVAVVPSPLVIQAPRPGKLGIFLVGENEVQVRGAVPQDGTPPQLVVQVRAQEPVVVRFTGRWKEGPELYLKGESAEDVTWNCLTQDLPSLPVEIEAMLNGDAPVKITPEGGVPNTGKYTWVTPKVDKAHCTLRVIVRDASGREGTDASREFMVDSTPPRPVLEILPEPAGGR